MSESIRIGDLLGKIANQHNAFTPKERGEAIADIAIYLAELQDEFAKLETREAETLRLAQEYKDAHEAHNYELTRGLAGSVALIIKTNKLRNNRQKTLFRHLAQHRAGE